MGAWSCGFVSNLICFLYCLSCGLLILIRIGCSLLKGRQGKAWEVIHKQALDPSDSLRRAGQKWFQQQTSLHKTLTVSSDKGVKTLIVRCSSCSSCSKQWCFSNREGQFHGFPFVVVCYVKGHHYEATASLEAWGIRATAAKKMNPEPRDRKELVSLQGFNPNFGAQPVCATWKDIEFECSLLPHARRWQQGSIKFELIFFWSWNQIVSKSRSQPRPFWRFKRRNLLASPQTSILAAIETIIRSPKLKRPSPPQKKNTWSAFYD